LPWRHGLRCARGRVRPSGIRRLVNRHVAGAGYAQCNGQYGGHDHGPGPSDARTPPGTR
jgi:hypothetical protein